MHGSSGAMMRLLASSRARTLFYLLASSFLLEWAKAELSGDEAHEVDGHQIPQRAGPKLANQENCQGLRSTHFCAPDAGEQTSNRLAEGMTSKRRGKRILNKRN